MSEFNVGDKVRATESLAWGSVPEGKTGVITEATSYGTVRVDFGPEHRKGDDAWWQNEARLELVDPFPEEGVRYRHSYTGLIYYVEDGKVMVEDPQEGDFQSASTIEDLVRRKSTYKAIGSREVEQERLYYRGFYSGTQDSGTQDSGYRFWAEGDSVVKANHGEPDSRATETGWLPEDLTTNSFFQPYGEEDTRSEMNRKMDTVREAGDRRRQKLIAHTHKLESVIRDRNAEIDFLREKLAVAQRGAVQANNALYDATFGFVKPSQSDTTNIPF